MQKEENLLPIQIFLLIVLLAFFAMSAKLWSLQVVRGSELRKLAEGNRIRAIPLESPRGSIYDRNNGLLAGNKQSITVTLAASKAKNRKIIKELADLLRIDEKEILERIEAQNKKLPVYSPRIIATDLDLATATVVAEKKSSIPGVDVVSRAVRYYPNMSLAAHVLGYTGEISDTELAKFVEQGYAQGDTIGKMGIERSYEAILRGQKGGRQIEVDAMGRTKRVLSTREAIPGHSLGLTIDSRIQNIVEDSLIKAIRNAKRQGARRASGGAAIVMDPNNGEILAMASYPTFNPNDFTKGIRPETWRSLNDKKSEYPLNNRAIMAVYPPASTFKPMSAIAGYLSNLISGHTTTVCNGKWYGQGKKWPKSCWKKRGHGRVNLVSAIAQSCDVYFYEIGFKLWKSNSDKIQDTARLFGFGELTGVDLPWEKKGRIPDREWKRWWNRNNPSNQVWLPGDNVNLSIGQGDMLATPIQIANMYAALASGGKLYRPHILRQVISSDGRVVRKIGKQVIRQNLSTAITRYLDSGLRQVAVSGTAKGSFSNFPIKVSGKTGTAQVWGKDDYALFAAYGPIPDPKYVVVMVVEQGKSGGSITAPAVREIFGRIFDLPETVSEIKGVVDNSR